MNAAARLVHKNVLSRQLVAVHFITREQMVMMAMVLAVLLSALSMIYVTHLSRILHAGYQHNKVTQERLQVERGQLLLERSTWMIQSRIEQIAENKLGMVIPDHKSIIIVHE